MLKTHSCLNARRRPAYLRRHCVQTVNINKSGLLLQKVLGKLQVFTGNQLSCWSKGGPLVRNPPDLTRERQEKKLHRKSSSKKKKVRHFPNEPLGLSLWPVTDLLDLGQMLSRPVSENNHRGTLLWRGALLRLACPFSPVPHGGIPAEAAAAVIYALGWAPAFIKPPTTAALVP